MQEEMVSVVKQIPLQKHARILFPWINYKIYVYDHEKEKKIAAKRYAWIGPLEKLFACHWGWKTTLYQWLSCKLLPYPLAFDFNSIIEILEGISYEWVIIYTVWNDLHSVSVHAQFHLSVG